MLYTSALVTTTLLLAARVAAIMRQPLASLEEAASPGGKQVARRTCPPAFDSLLPDAAPVALLTSSEERAVVPPDHHFVPKPSDEGNVRACPESPSTLEDLYALVLPKYKLAFCFIPKVACTQFKDLFNYMNGMGEESLGFGHDYWKSEWWRDDFNLSKEEITKENGWKFATFTRDPALRYLSAFGDVCQAANSTFGFHQWSCCGPQVDVRKAASDDRYQIKAFKSRVQLDVKAGRAYPDQHWATQTEVLKTCGWERFKPETLDYWGVLAGDVNAQVKEMLQVVGHRDDATVDRFFPPAGVAALESDGHSSALQGEAPDYIDAETLEGIVQLYAEDYRNMPGIGCAFTEPLLAKLKAANASNR